MYSYEERIRAVTLALTPGPNSFHASLLANPSEGWRSNLARVIRPELLREEGLKPYYTGEDTGTLYGWSIAVDSFCTELHAKRRAIPGSTLGFAGDHWIGQWCIAQFCGKSSAWLHS
jgi:hypothetical protein